MSDSARPVLRTAVDDLGTEVAIPAVVDRVVSLVPSLTEAIAVTRRPALVGATDWCNHPADLEVTRVRGTKNPNRQAIVDLGPDLVIANMEENRELDVRRLRAAGVPVWVTRIETVDQAFESMRRMFEIALGWDTPAWLGAAEEVWDHATEPLGIRVAVPVWRNPWFVIGSSTFAGDMLSRLGLENAFATASERYPKISTDELLAQDVDLVLLPDEPYEFSAADGPDALSKPTALISGRALTWYGPSLLTAREQLLAPILAAIAGLD